MGAILHPGVDPGASGGSGVTYRRMRLRWAKVQ
jgi:hypothetical protein